MNTDNRSPLRRAVDRLIAEGKLKQDKDLQEIFGLKKSTISAYLNNPKPGKRFIIDFEKKFGVSLKEFENDNIEVNKDAKIVALENEILKMKLDKIEINLNEMLSNQKLLMAMLAVAMDNAVEFYAAGNQKKAENLKNKMRIDIAAATK